MAIPEGNHNDWPWPLSKIPRSATAIPTTDKPKAIAHSKGLTKVNDIPNPGNWELTRMPGRWWTLNFAVTTKGGWHFRVGTFRWDAVDHYIQVPTLTLKKLRRS